MLIHCGDENPVAHVATTFVEAAVHAWENDAATVLAQISLLFANNVEPDAVVTQVGSTFAAPNMMKPPRVHPRIPSLQVGVVVVGQYSLVAWLLDVISSEIQPIVPVVLHAAAVA